MKRQLDQNAIYRAIIQLTVNIPLVNGSYIIEKGQLIDILLQAFFSGYAWPQ